MMKKLLRSVAISALALAGSAGAGRADDDHDHLHAVNHVLLVSVDGLHALDLARYVEKNPNSALAELSKHGVTFTNARTPANSDSFPGLLALVTGGSPISHGFFYDVSYDRTLFDPTNTSCTGRPGNTIVFDESIDAYDSSSPPVSKNVIDPTKLPRGIVGGKCVPIYPHAALKTNTIFEVVKAAGGRTAWADKHPAYDLVNGPSGKGVDDLYTPEITNNGGLDSTTSIDCTVANDGLKVRAIINQIDGKSHDGMQAVGVPNLFGMNFQAVSVGQKLANSKNDGSCTSHTHDNLPGGYVDGSGTPSDVLKFGLDQTDAALGAMISELKTRHLYESTLFIVSAKHGQSPINPLKVNKPGHFADLVAKMPGAASDPGAQAIANANNCSTGPCGFVQDDDVALIWLQGQDKSAIAAAAAFINKNAPGLFVDEVLADDDLELKFNDPTTDPRTPDIIVQPQYGTIYTSSTKKNAEHGGLSFGDTNVALLVSHPGIHGVVVKTPVTTAQVAPTILKALELHPDELHSVVVEHTPVLPGFEKK